MKPQNIPKEAKGWEVVKDSIRIIYRTVEEITNPKKKNKK